MREVAVHFLLSSVSSSQQKIKLPAYYLPKCVFKNHYHLIFLIVILIVVLQFKRLNNIYIYIYIYAKCTNYQLTFVNYILIIYIIEIIYLRVNYALLSWSLLTLKLSIFNKYQ